MASTMRSCQAFTASRPLVAVRPARVSVISASYKNKENIDLSKVAQYARDEKDTGSPEAQVATLSARVEQISKHLSTNRKDHSAKRGLIAVLNQRKSLLKYLHGEDREAFDRLVKDFNIRGVVIGNTRRAGRTNSSV